MIDDTLFQPLPNWDLLDGIDPEENAVLGPEENLESNSQAFSWPDPDGDGASSRRSKPARFRVRHHERPGADRSSETAFRRTAGIAPWRSSFPAEPQIEAHRA